MTGTTTAGATTGLVVEGSGDLVSIARFWKFDRKPVIDSGDLDAAAMIYDAKKKLPFSNSPRPE